MAINLADVLLNIRYNTQGLAQAQRELVQIDKNIKAAQASLNNWTTAQTQAKQRLTQVDAELRKVQSQVGSLARQQKNATTASQQNSQALAAAKTRASQLRQEYQSLTSTIDRAGKAINSANTALQQNQRQQGQLANRIQQVPVGVQARTGTPLPEQFVQPATQATKNNAQAANVAAEANKKYTDRLRNLGSSAVLILGPLNGVGARLASINAILGRAGSLWQALGFAIVAGAIAALAIALAIGARAEKEFLQLENVVANLGSRFGATAEDLDEFARKLGRDTLTSASVARRGLISLGTSFGITSDIMKEALIVSQDLAATGFGSLETSARRLARILEEPSANTESLRRFNIQLNESQKQQIALLEAGGNRWQAQKRILEEFNQVSGNANKEAGGLAGAIDTLIERFTEWFEGLARNTGLIKLITFLINGMSAAIEKTGKLLGLIDRDKSEKIERLTEDITRLEEAISVLNSKKLGPDVSGEQKRLLEEYIKLLKEAKDELELLQTPEKSGAGRDIELLTERFKEFSRQFQDNAEAAFELGVAWENLARVQDNAAAVAAKLGVSQERLNVLIREQGIALAQQDTRTGSEKFIDSLRNEIRLLEGDLKELSLAGSDLSLERTLQEQEQALIDFGVITEGSLESVRSQMLLIQEQFPQVAATISGLIEGIGKRNKELESGEIQEALWQEIDLIKTQTELLYEGANAAEVKLAIKKKEIELLNRGIALNSRLAQQELALVEALVQAQQEYQLVADSISFVEELGTSAFESIGETLNRAFKDGEDAMEAFRNVALNIINDVLNAIMQLAVINPIKDAIFGTSSPNLGSVFGAIGGLLGGIGGVSNTGATGQTFATELATGVIPMAEGGPVGAGRSFLVGEEGAELFVPRTNGTIVPNNKMGQEEGGGGTTIVMDLRGSNGDAAIEAAVHRGIARAAPTLVNQSVLKTIKTRNRDPNKFR